MRLRKLGLLTGVFAMAALARATDYYWTGAAGDHYVTTAGNWSLTEGGEPCTEPPSNEVGSDAVLVFKNIASALTVSNAPNESLSTPWNYSGYRFSGTKTAEVTLGCGTGKTRFALGSAGIVSDNKQKGLFHGMIKLRPGTNVFNTVALVRYRDIDDDPAGECVVYKTGSGSFGNFSNNTGYEGYSYSLATLVLHEGKFVMPNLAMTHGKVVWDGGDLSIFGTEPTFTNGWEATARGLEKGGAFARSSTAAKTVTVQGPASSFPGTFVQNDKNALNLIWDPTEETDEFVWSKGYFAGTASTLTIKGVMRFTAEAYVKSAAAIVVETNGKLTLDASAGTFGAVPLTLKGTTSRLRLNGLGTTLNVSSLTVNGTAIPVGRYCSDASHPWLEGEGMVFVGAAPTESGDAVAATWTNGGGDNLLTNADNWQTDGTLNLKDGSVLATFPADATPIVPSGDVVFLRGIEGAGALTLTREANAPLLLLGSKGLTTAGALTLSANVLLTAPQAWTAATGSEITADGHVAAYAKGNVWTNKMATVTICSTNERLPNSVIMTEVATLCADHALGGANTTVTGPNKKFLTFVGSHTYGSAFYAQGGSDGQKCTYFEIASGDVVLEGKVTCTADNQCWWHFATDAGNPSVTFRGGMQYNGNNNNSMFSGLHKGTITFERKPFDVTRMVAGFNNTYKQTLNLNVASNKTTRGLHILYRSTLNTTVPDALYATATGSSGVTLNYETTWNLSADQGVNILNGRSDSAQVTSANGSTLLLRDDRLNTVKSSETQKELNGGCTTLLGEQVKTNLVQFAGNVNFTKAGQLTHYLLGTSTSTGTLSVQAGRLEFLEGGCWANASTVRVSGTGVLALRKRDVNREADFVIDTANGASVEVPSGTRVLCRSLTVDGEEIPAGTTYTGTGVTGGGKVFVGKSGVVLIVR